MIYLDNNATTALDERVYEAMCPWLKTTYGNPSSVHHFGRKARAALDHAREQVAALVNAHPSHVIFTSGGTESNNFAIKALCTMFPRATLAISAIEHASVLSPVSHLVKQGWQLETLPVSPQGRVETRSLSPQTRLVSVMWANNEMGAIQPITHFSALCREQKSIFHTDASQAVGKIPVDFIASGAHLMTFSGHKFHAPQGVGVLLTDKTCELEPLLHGGGQEKGLRGGTEPVATIVGFGKAAELALQEYPQRQQKMLALRTALEHAIRPFKEVHIVAEQAERLPNTLMLIIEGFTGETLVMEFDRCGIAISSGSACHSEHAEPSHVLLAMGYTSTQAKNAIRISFSAENTLADVDAFVRVLKQQLDNFHSFAAMQGLMI
jgi:cysteine desulfurase